MVLLCLPSIRWIHQTMRKTIPLWWCVGNGGGDECVCGRSSTTPTNGQEIEVGEWSSGPWKSCCCPPDGKEPPPWSHELALIELLVRELESGDFKYLISTGLFIHSFILFIIFILAPQWYARIHSHTQCRIFLAV